MVEKLTVDYHWLCEDWKEGKKLWYKKKLKMLFQDSEEIYKKMFVL